MNEISLITNEDGDYEALYVNGNIVVQGSSVPRFEITDAFSAHQPHNFSNREVTAEWIENFGGNYPDSLSEIPDEAYTN